MPEQATPRQTPRAAGLATVLRAIVESGPVSRAEVARLTGLTAMTVGRAAGDLLAAGLIVEGEKPTVGTGRPAAPLAAGGAHRAIAIMLGPDAVRSARLGLNGALTDPRTTDLPLGSSPEAAAAVIARLADDERAEAERQGEIVVGLGVNVPAFVADGAITAAPILGWGSTDLASLVGHHLGDGAPRVLLETRAAAACLALPEHNAGTGVSAHVEAGYSLWTAVRVDDRVQRGDRGQAGGLGAMSLGLTDPRVLQDVAGLRAVLDAVDPSLQSAVDARRLTRDEAVRRLAGLADRAEAGAREALAQAGEALGWALTAVTRPLDPSLLTVGGYPSHLARWVEPGLRRFSPGALIVDPDATRPMRGVGLLVLREMVIADPRAWLVA